MWISVYIIGCCAFLPVALWLMPRRRESAPITEQDAAVEQGAVAARGNTTT